MKERIQYGIGGRKWKEAVTGTVLASLTRAVITGPMTTYFVNPYAGLLPAFTQQTGGLHVLLVQKPASSLTLNFYYSYFHTCRSFRDSVL
jgi:hypothetical protein